MNRLYLLLIPLSIALSIALPLLFGGLEALEQLRELSLVGFAVILAMVLASWAFNAARMHVLVNGLGVPLRPGRAYAYVVSAEFAGAATPAYTGGMATYMFLFSRQGLRFGQSAAVVAVDQLTDLVFMATALPVALLIFMLGPGAHDLAWAAGAFVGVLAVSVPLLFWLPRHYRPAALWLGKVMRVLPFLHRMRWRLARWLIQFREGIRLIAKLGAPRLLLTYFFCVGQWLLRYGTLPMVVYFLGFEVPWSYLFVAQAIILSVGHVTFLPGGTVGVELTFGALLAPYLPPDQIVASVLLWRFCTFHSYLIMGAPVFLLTAGRQGMEIIERRRKGEDAADERR